MSKPSPIQHHPQLFGQPETSGQPNTPPLFHEVIAKTNASVSNDNTPAPIVLVCPVKMEDTVLLMLIGLSLMFFGGSLLPYGEGGKFLGWTFLVLGIIATTYALFTCGVQKLIAYIDARCAIRDKRYTSQAYIGAFLGLCLGLLLPPLIPVLMVGCASLAVRNAKKRDIMVSEQAAKSKHIWGE